MRLGLILFVLFVSWSAKAQYSFSGHIDTKKWHDHVYLSIIEDYRKISGIYTEQIILKTKTDATGYFIFSGNQLDNTQRIYRIHVENCENEDESENHFNGHCTDSKDIIFLATNNDTIRFPFSFDKEMFCDIESNNIKTAALIKVDSLKEEMKFAFKEFRSEASRKLNNKKWFKTLQNFGKQLNEPLAELYLYSFLSDRRNDFHAFYLEDLKTNSYYDDLLNRLVERYPNSTYSKQFKTELMSDKYILSEDLNNTKFNWNYFIWFALFLSTALNIYFFASHSKRKKVLRSMDHLTKQEQNILELILEDKSNKEIAEALFVSVSTVKTHINNIFKKLKTQSRDDLKKLYAKQSNNLT